MADRYGFTDEQVAYCRAEAEHRTAKDIAREFGVSNPTMQNVVNGRTYRHLPGARKLIKGRRPKPPPEPTLCVCGCGELASPGRRWIQGHNLNPGAACQR